MEHARWYAPSKPYGSTEEWRVNLSLTTLKLIRVRGGDHDNRWALLGTKKDAVFLDPTLSADQAMRTATNLYLANLESAVAEIKDNL